MPLFFSNHNHNRPISNFFLIKKQETRWINGKVTSDVYRSELTTCSESSSVTSPGTGSVSKCCQDNLCNAIGNLTLPIVNFTTTSKPNAANQIYKTFNAKLIFFVNLLALSKHFI